LREGVKEFIAQLYPTKSLLVSGDGDKVVAKVAQVCQINEWHAGFHPLDKKALVDQLMDRGEIVAMIGDGINDAPALTASHIGIAVVSASDISIQVSDLLMTTNNFQALTMLRQAALKGRKIVKQNLFWAFFYNCIGIALAMTGMLTPLFAAFAMIMSSLIVLLNAQRMNIKRNKDTQAINS
jgi:P-type E1-E2 ATPase